MLKFILSLILFTSVSYTQWAINVGSTGTDQISGIAVDGNGNVFVTGYFKGTADLDPGAGTTNLVSSGQYDIFFAKYNSAGNLLWAKRVGSTSYDYGRSIVIDKTGNVLITGDFRGTVDFDSGDNSTELTSAGGSDVFFAKYNTSGELLWAKNVGGSGYEHGEGIGVDNSGNIFITGYIPSGTADFDPDVATVNLTSAGDDDIFFAKYSSDGDIIWAKNFGGTLEDHGYSIAVDYNGNVYVSGKFNGTADFDPGNSTSNITSSNNNEAFYAKYNSSGEFDWAVNIEGTSNDFEYSLAVDSESNLYITGIFQGTADFDPGAGTVNLSSAGSYDIYLAKYNPSGSLLWAKSIGGTSGDYAYEIKVDYSKNIYLTGYFVGTSDFDPGSGVTNLDSNGGSDVFFSKYNSSGDFIWAKNIGSTSTDKAYTLAADESGNVYVGGEFTGTVDFDPGAGESNLTNSNGLDIFLAKYNSTGVISLISINLPSGGESWNQNSSQNITWYSTGVANVKIEFSPDGGATWNTVVESINASAGSYNWTIPALSTFNVLLKITDLSNSSVFSISGIFTISLTAPVLYLPKSESVNSSTTPTFAWSKIPGITRYNLLISTDYYFTSIVLQKQLQDTSYQQITPLNHGTKYYWKASAVNSQGNAGEYSAPFNFTTKLTTPTLGFPVTDSTGVSFTPTLNWSAVTGADKYRLEVNTALDFAGTVIYDNSALTSISKKIGGLSDSTKYYWRVTAANASGNSSSASTVSNFTTLQTVIDTTLIVPANGATGLTLTPTLTWPAVSGADKYRIELNTSINFDLATSVLDSSNITSTSIVVSGLTANTTYYWRVTASSNALAKTNKAVIYTFTTGTVTGIEALKNIIPESYTLSQNYPNPFNPSTIIRYALPSESKVTIKIYNLLGQELNQLVNSTESAGYHEVNFNASNIASGIYFYRISAVSFTTNETFTEIKKMILLR